MMARILSYTSERTRTYVSFVSELRTQTGPDCSSARRCSSVSSIMTSSASISTRGTQTVEVSVPLLLRLGGRLSDQLPERLPRVHLPPQQVQVLVQLLASQD